MEDIILKAKLREVKGKQVKALRQMGLVPAIIYGRHMEPIRITLDAHEVSKVLPTLSSSHLVTIDLDGTAYTVLAREKQREPIMGKYIHIDFLGVSLTEKLRTSVSIVIFGTAPAVTTYNGVVVTGIENIEVEALPKDLPDHLIVDVNNLVEIGDALYVKDINIPAGVRVLTDLNEMVVLVTGQALESEEEFAPGMAEPEIIERGKKEEDF